MTAGHNGTFLLKVKRMTFFSRLTDIVTCNLTKLIEEAEDPVAAIDVIITEMREGLAGANRSLKTAETNVSRIQSELEEHRGQISRWNDKAKSALSEGREAEARQHLIRKKEVDALVAGLEQQFRAAEGTREHLTTTLRALEARLLDAQRRQAEIKSKTSSADSSESTGTTGSAEDIPATLSADVDAELAALKKELEG